MIALLLGMLICVVLAATVLLLVALPARREGREILTDKGESVLEAVRERVPGR